MIMETLKPNGLQVPVCQDNMYNGLTFTVLSNKFELLAKYSSRLHELYNGAYFRAREAQAIMLKLEDELESVKRLLNKVKQ